MFFLRRELLLVATLLLTHTALCTSLRVVVFGGTGRTGKYVVEKCMLDGRVDEVVCVARDLAKGRQLFGRDTQKLSILPADVTRDSSQRLARLVEGADAVICATGFSPTFPPDPLGAFKVDSRGTRRLIDACIQANIPRFVLMTSLLTNGFEAGQALNPQYLLLNSFGGILFHKRAAEKHLERQIQSTTLSYCIVRPGGLVDESRSPPHLNPILFKAQDTLFGGAISRPQVAEVLLEAALNPYAKNKIVEIVATPTAVRRSYDEVFSELPWSVK